MNRIINKISIVLILPIACLFVMSTGAIAVNLLPLQMDYDGNFTYGYYTDGTGTDVNVPYLLNFTDFFTTSVFYLNGEVSGVDGVAADVLEGANVAWVFNGSFYNDDDQDDDPNNSGWNYIFGNTNNGGTGAEGVTGQISFEIKDTVTDEVFLTAELSNFVADPCMFIAWPLPGSTDCTSFDPRVNNDYSMNSLWSLDVGSDYASSSSRYIQELGSVLNRDDGVVYNTDINMTFTMLAGSTDNDFIGNSNGTVQGTLVVMPEPVSSILFIVGGATLAIRRSRNRKSSMMITKTGN